MRVEKIKELVELSQECLTRFWQLDAEFVIKYFDKNILWIGSAQSQFTEGYAETVMDFRNIMRELKPCHLLQQEFFVVQNMGNACTIAGRYLTTTDKGVDYFLQVQQRCTFVWELVGGEPKLKHCHISNPMGELKLAEGEKFTNALGEMSKIYWAKQMESINDRRRIVVTDTQGVVHFLHPYEVVYVNADKRKCIIHTTTGTEIEARISITDFLVLAGDGFSAAHRSYVLNKAYISCIRKYEIVMANGSKVPIPERRYNEIRNSMADIHNIPKNKS